MTIDARNRISRRTLAAGAAWAVPVVTITAAAPHVSASGEVYLTGGDIACKVPGDSCVKNYGLQSGYAITARVCSTVPSDVTINFGDATVTLNGVTTTGWAISPNPLDILNTTSGTDCETVVIGLAGTPNSAEGRISGTIPYTWTAANGQTGTGTFPFAAPTTPPCKKCTPVALDPTPTP